MPDADDLALAGQVLSPSLMTLFLRMQASEQAHSLWIFRQLRQANGSQFLAGLMDEWQRDFLAAALLHDVGKVCYPLHLWERVVIVLGKAFFPNQARRWGQGEPYGWKRAFVVAEQHAVWGADMAAQAGASLLTVRLIGRHQDHIEQQDKADLEDRLLIQLQSYDDER